MLNKSFLEWIELAIFLQTFHSLNRAPFHPNRQLAARISRLPIEQNRTSSALTAIAPDLRTREIQMVAQDLDQSPPVLDLHLMLGPVHCEFDLGLRNRSGRQRRVV